VKRAAELGLTAIAITDRNSVAGVVRAFSALKELARITEEAGQGASLPRLIPGARLVLTDSPVEWVALPTDLAAWSRLTRLLSLGKRRAEKGSCHIGFADLEEWARGMVLIALPPDPLEATGFERDLRRIAARFAGQCFLGAESMKTAKWLNYLPATTPSEAPAATAEGAAAAYALRSILETWWPRRDEAAPDGLWQDTQFVYEAPPGRPKGDGLSLGSKFVTALDPADINALDAGRPPWSMRWKPGTQSQTYYELPRGTPWLDPAYTLLQRLGGQNAVPAYDPATAQGLSLQMCWNAFLGIDERTSPACVWTSAAGQ